MPDDLDLSGGFDLHLRTRLVGGHGALQQLGEWVRELGGRRVLVVTDPGLVAAGHAGQARALIEESGADVSTFDAVHHDPTTEHVDACLDALREVRPDLLVAVGGGSSIDTAKGANFLYTNGGAMEDYWGVGKASKPMLPLIAVPTTAGTGSEVQSFALIERAADHQKMACGDSKAAPVLAILDPDLTRTQPPFVAACTGLDALTHAVEASVTRKRNAVSDLFAGEAFRLAQRHLPRVLAQRDDAEARAAMLRAAAFAGIAIEHSMLGAAHSMANPLTARFELAHGQAVSMMLPHVVRYNAADPGARAVYERLARSTGLCTNGAPEGQCAALLAAEIERLLDLCGMPGSLAEFGVSEDALPELSAQAARQWTAGFNPRKVGEDDFRYLYRSALEAR